MLWSSRNKVVLTALSILVLTAGGWLYANRARRINIATYVPESALGYLEINDWPRTLDRLTSTKAWEQLAPLYGISDSLKYAGGLGWLASFGRGGETAILARSQFALVVTGLEVRGEEVKPALALIVETHSNAGKLQKVVGARLPKFAQSAFGGVVEETSEHSGVKVTRYRATDSERSLFSAQIESELIVANQIDALQICIDTRLSRAASMVNNFYLQNARSIVERDGSAFGFVTSEGVKRLLRFGAYLVSGGVIGKAALAGAVGEIFTEFSTRTSDGIAYGASFENGETVDRYALLFKPELVDTLRAVIKPSGKEVRAFEAIPVEAYNITLTRVENPIKTLDGIEAAISGRVGVAQSFLLHQFVLSVREAFFGLQNDRKAQDAIGDEIVSFDLPFREKEAKARGTPARSQGLPGRVWLVEARDSALMLAIVERAMVANRAVLSREKYRGFEILSSSDAARGSAVFIGDFLLLGKHERLLQVIDLLASGRSVKNSPRFAAAAKLKEPVPIISYNRVDEETGEMMTTIARWTGEKRKDQAVEAKLDQLPFAVSTTSLTDRGILVESHSPFGNIPSVLSIAAGVTNGR